MHYLNLRTEFLVLLVYLASLTGFIHGDEKKEIQLRDYLPQGVEYNSAIPMPSSVLGYEVGEWHVRHDQLLQYFKVLATLSPRFELNVIGHSYEKRPLIHVVVTSKKNQDQLEDLRKAHLKRLQVSNSSEKENNAEAELETESEPNKESQSTPLVVWMGYSVHGNESSGANASLILAYHLAAAQGEEIEKMLNEMIIVIDPCLNPDGLSRFAQWANTHKGAELVADPAHREHREGWPSGRTNHYWFDLNRDWLLLTHPESRARITQFRAWMPNVVTDFHEMHTHRTYFFQPGVPTRQHPWTPKRNLELTREIAKYHAKALDKEGKLYYTEESFDDFYYGKGSTYPDAHGAIGILFEQASSRGHLQESPYGNLSFPETIKNQVTTSFSTLEAAFEKRAELLEYQETFYKKVPELAAKDRIRAYLIKKGKDPARLFHFVDLLQRHGIATRRLARTFEQDGIKYGKNDYLIIPVSQPQYRLIRAIFEKRTKFEDDTFYDVSTWTFPLSFGLESESLDVFNYSEDLMGKVIRPQFPKVKFPEEEALAYAIDQRAYYSPKVLQGLLEKGLRLTVATRPFGFENEDGSKAFGYGTVVVPLGIQDLEKEKVIQLLKLLCEESGVPVTPLTTGLTDDGVDLGSPSLIPMKLPKPVLLVGSGVSTYEAGEVWHLLDQRYGMPLTIAEGRDFSRLDWKRYTHLLLVDGSYSFLSADQISKLKDWVRDGGIVVAQKGAALWAGDKLLGRSSPGTSSSSTESKSAKDHQHENISYADYEKMRAKSLIGGSIFLTELDPSHPLAFGYQRKYLPIFRNSTMILPSEKDPLTVPFRYTGNARISGYCSEKNEQRISKTPAVCANRLGSGCVIRLIDNVNFRGVWYGTNKIYANALFFGSVIKRTYPLPSE